MTTLLRFSLPAIVLNCAVTICLAAAPEQPNRFPVITASGEQITSFFDGRSPNQQVRAAVLLKPSVSMGPGLTTLRGSDIGKMLGIGPTGNDSTCQVGICAQPGTTQSDYFFICADDSGCVVNVHNQVWGGDFGFGTDEEYHCEQCCVDWVTCPIGDGGGPEDPTPGSPSPIVIDVEGEGFHLTSAGAGVSFDISGTGHPIEIAWTDPKFHNAFLALPGPDGLVHNGKELFGNFTPQPPSDHPNGFLALAEYDKTVNGGNGDGVIDQKDAVFGRLRLWIDENHDGVCQANELHKLEDLGVYSVALSYVESRRTDEFGNAFRYKAKVNIGKVQDVRDERQHGEAHEVGRWAWDVFFATK